MDKNSFLIYLDYEEQFNLLTDEQVGQLMRAIIKYEKTGNVPELEGMLKMAFSFIKTQLDRDREKYNKKCEQNRENAKKGGRPKKQKNNFENKKANGFEENQMDTEKPDNDNEDEEDIDDDIEKKNSKRKTFAPPTLEEVEKYVLEKKLNVNAKNFYDYFTEGNWIDRNGNEVKNWKQKILTWNGYRDTGQKQEKSEKKVQQREYSEDDFNNLYVNVGGR